MALALSVVSVYTAVAHCEKCCADICPSLFMPGRGGRGPMAWSSAYVYRRFHEKSSIAYTSTVKPRAKTIHGKHQLDWR